MADEQKPVETPKEAPATETVPAEVKPTEETKTEDKPAEAAAVAEAAPAEAPKEEAKPVEEGTLEHKSAESKLPKNFLYSKEAFWFGSDAVETDKLAGYVKAAKNVDVAHQNAAWAASTGKGLLFVGSKDTPTGIINLGEASDVTTDGPVKFHFSASGFKHTFKASTKADAENWVSQLKLKITEAKASKEAVVATEAYTQAMEGFKPTPAKKEEPSAEPATEEAKTEEAVPEAPVVEEAKEEVKTEEPAKDEVKTEEEAAKETKEEPKRRSASRKRESVNIMSFFKKEKKESKAEEKPAETVAATETPAEASTDAPAATEEPVVEPVASTEEAKVEEEPKEKPSIQKRASIFAGVFGKKEKKAAEEPAKGETTEVEAPAATSETAPVIPPVEATTPLDAGISAGTVPTETKEVTPATNGESKKEVKSEKRKSSLPFFHYKEKTEKSDGEEKAEKTEKKSQSPFSKLRATIKGRTKSAEKTEDKPVESEAAPVEAPKEEAAKPAEEEPVNKPEPAAVAAPAVTAAA